MNTAVITLEPTVIELIDKSEKNCCFLKWLHGFDEIQVTLESKNDFKVSRSIFHSRETFSQLTSEILEFLKTLREMDCMLAREFKELGIHDCNRQFSLRCDSCDNGYFQVGIDLNSHHDDIEWFVGLYVNLNHQQLDVVIEAIQNTVLPQLTPRDNAGNA